MNDPRPLQELALPPKDNWALFLDFDGTLVNLVDHPENVMVLPKVPEILAHISNHLKGAVAIVTGREIQDIDKHLAPIHFPVAGIHGLTRRTAEGDVIEPNGKTDFLDDVKSHLTPLLKRHTELHLEMKSHSLALHYRGNPDLEQMCIDAIRNGTHHLDNVELLRGKMVVEAKLGGFNKGIAVSDYLREPPFHGRLPVYAGDDLTDEDAFEVVNSNSGHSIKVGAGNTKAKFRIQSSDDFVQWLNRLAVSI